MKYTYRVGQRVRHRQLGLGIVKRYRDRVSVEVDFQAAGVHVVDEINLTPAVFRWSEVEAGDTVEFECQGETIKVEAKGDGPGQVTVLGFRITDIDNIWDLRYLKKRNPPVPTRLGSRVMYRDKQWLLVYGAMVISDHETVGNMIWVEINENQFNWVGHEDIDREKFEVIFSGWKGL